MIRLFICDDDSAERKRIENNLLVYMSNNPSVSIDYCVFSSPYEMLYEAEKSGAPDIVLLDIYMPEMTGMETAKVLLRISSTTDIIFITTSSDYALDAFSLHAYDYIKKPFTQEKFDSSIGRAVKEKSTKEWILLTSDGKIHRIDIDDIIYVETVDKRRLFVLKSGEVLKVWLSSKELEELLLHYNGIIRCGGSYIVNLANTRSFSKNNMVMVNGALIPVPRRLRTTLKDQYFEYYKGEARRNAGD